MTQSLAKLLALPFVLYLIYFFTSAAYEQSPIHTYLFLLTVVVLALLYVFQFQVNIWYWKKRPPRLSPKLLSWIAHHSDYYNALDQARQLKFEKRIALFMKLKTFTLKVEKEFDVEEDMKAIIAHEFQKVVLNRNDYYFSEYDQIVLYNHPFPSPIIEKLHALEIHDEDGVIIFSREQLINGFIHPADINIGLLAAIMTFVRINPRLDYPVLKARTIEEIAASLDIDLEPLGILTGEPWIKKLDLLIYVYFEMPLDIKSWDQAIFDALNAIFQQY